MKFEPEELTLILQIMEKAPVSGRQTMLLCLQIQDKIVEALQPKKKELDRIEDKEI